MSHRSLHWASIRAQAKKRAQGCCEECGKPTAEYHVHHLTYARRGKELLTDVLAICLPCHEAKHPGLHFYPIREQHIRAKRRRGKRVGRTKKAGQAMLKARELWRLLVREYLAGRILKGPGTWEEFRDVCGV